MAQTAKYKKAIKHLSELKALGYSVPPAAIQFLQQEYWNASGVKQIWLCTQCPGFLYESPVRISGIGCPEGHRGNLLWESPKEPIGSAVALLQGQPKSLENQDHQQNNQSVQDTSYKFPSLSVSLGSSLRKTDT